MATWVYLFKCLEILLPFSPPVDVGRHLWEAKVCWASVLRSSSKIKLCQKVNELTDPVVPQRAGSYVCSQIPMSFEVPLLVPLHLVF